MPNPKVSVVIATHNRSTLLTRAVNSILTQTQSDFEIIIVDDASTDETPRVINNIENIDHRVRSIHSDKNIGPGASRNLGADIAQGDFIAIMDDDDIAYPDRLAMSLNAFKNNPEASFVFSSIDWFDDENKIFHSSPGLVLRGEFPDEPPEVFKFLYLNGYGIPNQTIMAKKSLWNQFKYPDYPWVGEDWFYFMQLAASGVKMKAISKPLVKIYKGIKKESLTSNNGLENYKNYLFVHSMTRAWLTQQQITKFDKLHKLSLSNLHLRESRNYGIFAFWIIMKAWFLAPYNRNVLKQVSYNFRKVPPYLRRLVIQK